jgi:hypothetical protein
MASQLTNRILKTLIKADPGRFKDTSNTRYVNQHIDVCVNQHINKNKQNRDGGREREQASSSALSNDE